MKIFQCVWLEADKEHSGGFSFDPFSEAFLDMDVSYIQWTSEGGDACFEIDVSQEMINSICSVLIEHKVISKSEGDDIILAEIDVITLY